MRVTYRRVATKRLYHKRVIGTRTLSLFVGTITWTTMPRWYRSHTLG